MPMPSAEPIQPAIGVDPAGLATTLGGGSSRRQKRWIGDQGNRIERDTDGIEDRGGESACGIEQQQAGKGECADGCRENDGQTAAAKEPCAEQSCAEMNEPVGPEMRGTLPRAGFQRSRVLDDEECGGVEPDEGRERRHDEREWNRRSEVSKVVLISDSDRKFEGKVCKDDSDQAEQCRGDGLDLRCRR